MSANNLNLTNIVGTWRKRIKLAKKTEEQAARESGLSKPQLSYYLNGKNEPGIRNFEKFENYLRGLGV